MNYTATFLTGSTFPSIYSTYHVLFILWPHMIDFCIVFKLLFVHIFFYFLLEDMKENYEIDE